MAKAKDKFSQVGFISVTESAANTLSFDGISVFSNILTPKAILIHRVYYVLLDDMIDLLLADGDVITYGLCGDNSLTAISYDDARVYDLQSVGIHDAGGTPATYTFWKAPVIIDFGSLPGGGKLVPADRLYAFVKGSSLATAVSMAARFEFTLVDLNAQEYIELAQALRVLT